MYVFEDDRANVVELYSYTGRREYFSFVNKIRRDRGTVVDLDLANFKTSLQLIYQDIHLAMLFKLIVVGGIHYN